jgi:hypothetical protein
VGVACSTHRRDENFIQNFDRKGGRTRILGRPSRGWKYNIRKDLRKIGREVVVRFHVVQDSDQWRAVLNTVMNLWVPQKAKNF